MQFHNVGHVFVAGLTGYNAAIAYLKSITLCSHKQARNTLATIKQGKPLFIKTAGFGIGPVDATMWARSDGAYEVIPNNY